MTGDKDTLLDSVQTLRFSLGLPSNLYLLSQPKIRTFTFISSRILKREYSLDAESMNIKEGRKKHWSLTNFPRVKDKSESNSEV